MRENVAAVTVGVSLSDVEEIVESAEASRGTQSLGGYKLGEADWLLPPERVPNDDSQWAVQGFWLRTGITCYLEFVVVDDLVDQVDEVYCEDDGWFE